MHLSASTLSTLLLFFTSLHPTAARVQIRTYTSPTTTSNSTALLACVNQMHSDLQANPRARAMSGYNCGDSTFYYGTPGLGGATGESDLYAVEKCEPNLTERAREGRDWFECRVRAAWGERRVGWKAMEGEQEEEEQFEVIEERDAIDGEEGDEVEELGLLEYSKERDAELADVDVTDDEVYEFGEAVREEGDWDDEIDDEEYDEDAGPDDEEDDEEG